MLQRRNRIFLMCVAGLLLAPTAHSQGLYWEASHAPKDTSGVSRFYLLPKMMKEVSADGERITIFRLDRDIMYQINARDKSYTQTTFAEMESHMKNAQSKLAEGMSKLKDKLDKIPPEQRKMLEQQMGTLMGRSSAAANVEVVNTGERATISGYSSTKTIFRRDGKDLITFWTTKEVKEFAPFRNELAGFMKRALSMNPFARDFADAFSKLDGFPVRTEMGGSTETVTRVEKRSLSASEFEVPAGFIQKKNPIGE
jgi:hypothetical protein